QRQAPGRPEVFGPLRERPGRGAGRRGDAGQGRPVRLEGDGLVAVVVDPHVAAAVRAAVRLLDLPDEPGAGWRLEGDVLREVACEADDAGLPEDRLQGRRRR